MNADRYWWIKVIALMLALAGVVWAQWSLQTKVQAPTKQEQQQSAESIPAKVEIGK